MRMTEKKGAEVVAPVPRAWEEKPELRGNQLDYPDGVKSEFLKRVLENGEHVGLVRQEMNVSKSTANRWITEQREEREPQIELENLRIIEKMGRAGEQFLDALITRKWEKASVRDLAIAFGIIIERRRDLLGPRKGSATTRLRVTWKSGEVEVETKSDT